MSLEFIYSMHELSIDFHSDGQSNSNIRGTAKGVVWQSPVRESISLESIILFYKNVLILRLSKVRNFPGNRIKVMK